MDTENDTPDYGEIGVIYIFVSNMSYTFEDINVHFAYSNCGIENAKVTITPYKLELNSKTNE